MLRGLLLVALVALLGLFDVAQLLLGELGVHDEGMLFDIACELVELALLSNSAVEVSNIEQRDLTKEAPAHQLVVLLLILIFHLLLGIDVPQDRKKVLAHGRELASLDDFLGVFFDSEQIDQAEAIAALVEGHPLRDQLLLLLLQLLTLIDKG